MAQARLRKQDAKTMTLEMDAWVSALMDAAARAKRDGTGQVVLEVDQAWDLINDMYAWTGIVASAYGAAHGVDPWGGDLGVSLKRWR